MAASLGKRITKWALLITPWLLTLLLAAGWGLSAWTPGYLEKLVPELADEMGLPLEEFHIRKAGLFSADIGPVQLGSGESALRLSNVRVTYTPASLKMGRVNEVALDGLTLHCFYENDQFRLPVLDLLPQPDTSSDAAGAKDKALPALPLDSLTITNAVLHCTVDDNQFTIPLSATVMPGKTLGVVAEITPRDQKILIAGELGPTMDDLSVELTTNGFKLGAVADLLPQPVEADVAMNIKAALNLSDPDSLKAEIETRATDVQLPGTGVELSPDTPLKVTANVTGKSVDFSLAPLKLNTPQPLTLTIPEGHVSAEAMNADFLVDTMGMALPGQLKAARLGDAWNFSLTTANPDRLAIQTDGRTIRLRGADINVTGTATSGNVDLVLAGSTKGASLDGIPGRSGAVRFSLPLAYPAPKRHTPGSLRISSIRYDKYKLGTVVAKMRQEGMGLGVEGTLYSQILPDLKVVFTGQASMETKDAKATFDIPRYVFPKNFDPASLVPALKNAKLTGNLSVEGGLTIHDGDIKSNMGVFVTNGSLVMGEEGTTRIDGIRLYFESPDLMNFRSAPAQLLAFDSLSAGPVTLGKGRVTFQLEPRGVTLVEHIGFDWVGGHVASRAFRIVPGHEEYDVTLFCSRLRLSDLLMQLGLAEAKGEATLSGEMPVTWKRGKISFNDGFLHSTPGQGGVIQVEAMQDLVSAIPQGTPQRGQIELAQAAIKDFEYKWVRLKADTVGDELMVRLSLDGKPASTLPFVYRKEFGGFAQVTGDMKGSNFQGLRLDVNFSLPLDQILLYKDIINMIE